MSIGSLGYIGFKVADPDAWAAFAVDVLGVMATDAPDGAKRFRMDAQSWRIAVEQGEEDDLAYLGFEVSGPEALEAMAARLSEAGVVVTEPEPGVLKAREVLGMFACTDPDGLRVEVYYGPRERRETPFVSSAGVSGFVTGDQGLGHVVIMARDLSAARRFYRDALGFRLSDVIHVQTPSNAGFDIEFYHCNPRHHTVALAPARGPKRLHHFMLQVKTLDDLGFALDRAANAKIPIEQSLGKHTNDHMVSFYARTPSGFQVEYGFGAREVDDATWRVARHDRTSMWGHKHRSAP